jgi:hypothetical protein
MPNADLLRWLWEMKHRVIWKRTLAYVSVTSHSSTPQPFSFQPTITATAKNKKDKKKTNKSVAEPPDAAVSTSNGQPEERSKELSVPEQQMLTYQHPVEMTADDIVDEEWGPVNEKGKKAKKGMGKKEKVNEDGNEPTFGE